MQVGIDEGATAALADEDVGGLGVELGDEFGPVVGKAKLGRGASVRPGAGATTLTRTTGRSRLRKAAASWAERVTISEDGVAVGMVTMPFWRSMTMRAAWGSSCERGMWSFSLRACGGSAGLVGC